MTDSSFLEGTGGARAGGNTRGALLAAMRTASSTSRRAWVQLSAVCGLALLTTVHVVRPPGLSMSYGMAAGGTGVVLAGLLLASYGTTGRPPRPTAHTDALTGLTNRDGLRTHIDVDHPPGDDLTLVAVDLDGLRRVNEEAGHETGDRIMRWMAGHLSALAEPDGLAARVNGDDFVIVLPTRDLARAHRVTHRLRRTVGGSVTFGGQRFHMNVNVAIVTDHQATWGHGDHSRSDQLLHCIDVALADAQSRTSGRLVHTADRCRPGDTGHLLRTIDELHTALARDDQLTVHLQPQHHIGRVVGGLSADTLSGCEALLRWEHPTRGLLGPSQAVAAAADGHLTRELTQRVLDLALRAAARWWWTRPLPVSVNLTTEDLDDDLLPHRIALSLAAHGLPPAALTLEVVEDSVMIDPERAIQTLGALRRLGLGVAIDDYGTGYSSLAYLHRLPVDKVKFDRALIADISNDRAARTIVQHSIRLAHDLSLSVTAEGVEDPGDLAELAALGCDVAQGYLTGRPQTVEQWLRLVHSLPADHLDSPPVPS